MSKSKNNPEQWRTLLQTGGDDPVWITDRTFVRYASTKISPRDCNATIKAARDQGFAPQVLVKADYRLNTATGKEEVIATEIVIA